MLINVSKLKHFASSSFILSQLALMGMHENMIVCDCQPLNTFTWPWCPKTSSQHLSRKAQTMMMDGWIERTYSGTGQSKGCQKGYMISAFGSVMSLASRIKLTEDTVEEDSVRLSGS